MWQTGNSNIVEINASQPANNGTSWLTKNEPAKVEAVFSKIHQTAIDPDLLLKQQLKVTNTTMSMLPQDREYRKRWLAMFVGMLQYEQGLSGQYHASVEPPDSYKVR